MPAAKPLDVGAVQREFARKVDQAVERMISEGKITNPSWWLSQRGRVALLGAVLASGLALILVYQIWLSGRPPDSRLPGSPAVATVLVAAIVSVFAYHQWNDSRRELSLDKFYERVRLVNDRYIASEHARNLVAHFWPGSDGVANFEKAIYVYLEIDNLEYIILRFQLGFVSRSLLRRAVRAFSSRCQSREFCALAKEVVKGTGYSDATVQVVLILVALVIGETQ